MEMRSNRHSVTQQKWYATVLLYGHLTEMDSSSVTCEGWRWRTLAAATQEITDAYRFVGRKVAWGTPPRPPQDAGSPIRSAVLPTSQHRAEQKKRAECRQITAEPEAQLLLAKRVAWYGHLYGLFSICISVCITKICGRLAPAPRFLLRRVTEMFPDFFLGIATIFYNGQRWPAACDFIQTCNRDLLVHSQEMRCAFVVCRRA